MSLSRKIAAAVAERTAQDAGSLAIEEGPCRLVLELTLASTVGVACDRLEFESSALEPRTFEAARSWAQRLSERVTYLLEPLKIMEADAASGAVLLRSAAPNHRDGRRTYFEATVTPEGRFTLTRHAFDEANRQRQAVACQLTIETLERLADDLAATVS